MAKKKYIWLSMTREWGGFAVGEVVRFGESKGVEREEQGFGVQVPEPEESKRKRADEAKQLAKAEADAKATAADEKANADKVETADSTPVKENAVGRSASKSKSKK